MTTTEMTGEEIIKWALEYCAKRGIPPTDSALIRVIRYWPKEPTKEPPSR